MTFEKRHSFSDFKEIQREKRSERGLSGPNEISSKPEWMDRYNGYTVQHFPPHLYPPRGSETVDIRESFTISDPIVFINLIDFTVPLNSIMFWRSYSMFTNSPSGVLSEFFFKVDGVSALKYHGSSINYFKKTLALGNDLVGEIDALVELRGGQRITVDAQVSSGLVASTLSARIKGWLMPAASMKIERIGS